MKKIIATVVCVAVLALVAVAQANQVRFLSRTSTGVAPSQDIHYTVMDLNGNKVAEDTVDAVEGEGVTINDIPAGTYFVSAEQPSTGYFGSVTTEIFAQDADENGNGSVDLVLDRDGLQVYNPEANQPVAPARATPVRNYPTTTYPSDANGAIPYYDGGSGAGFGAGAGAGAGSLGWVGLIGLAAGVAGLVVAITSASKTAE